MTTIVYPNCLCCGMTSSSSLPSSSSTSNDPCAGFASCSGRTYTLKASGIANFNCISCGVFNGMFTLRQNNLNNERGGGADCNWHYNFPSVCANTHIEYYLVVNGPFFGMYTYFLVIHDWTGYLLAQYSGNGADCNGTSVLSKVSGFTPDCGWPFNGVFTIS